MRFSLYYTGKGAKKNKIKNEAEKTKM